MLLRCLMFLLLLPVGAGAQQQAPDPDRVHDPAIIKEGDSYYLFSTGRGIPMHRSLDLVTWEPIGQVFDSVPAWAPAAVPGVRNSIWAPDISFFDGKYHLYYSLSTFGKNTSAIGLATNATLDPRDPRYRWVDEGKAIQSVPENQWNAIDPNLVLDEAGEPWLSWGSFWGGIKMRKIDRATGLPSRTDSTLYSLAARPVEKSIEAPFITRRDGYYYLFASYDFCCRGVESSYRVVVGRSRTVHGPYVDRYDVPMVLGGSTPVLSGAGRVRGPGHNAILVEGDRYFLVHHFYDAEANGRSRLQVRPLTWSRDGWPIPGDPLTR
jgi:arabinan endo-1,5-alpha-L-arabinosidase